MTLRRDPTFDEEWYLVWPGISRPQLLFDWVSTTKSVLFAWVSLCFGAVWQGIDSFQYPIKQQHTAHIPSQTAVSNPKTLSNRSIILWYPVKQQFPIQIPSQTAGWNSCTLSNSNKHWRYPVKSHLRYPVKQHSTIQIPSQTETDILDTQSNRTIFNTLSNSAPHDQIVIPGQTAFFSLRRSQCKECWGVKHLSARTGQAQLMSGFKRVVV